jgi:hypothetical protein
MEFFWDTFHNYEVTRFVFQRALGIIYFVAFLIFLNQGPALIGERGLLPAQLVLKKISFWNLPSLFHLRFSDQWMRAVGCLGIGLSVLVISGYSQDSGLIVSILVWLLLWVLYLSIVNIGQEFYGFGWETLLLESGFVAIFLGDNGTPVFLPIIWFYQWLLFRLMFGAGMIKWRGDSCWRDYTCMFYHYETQPMPNPFSRLFHHLPKWLHRVSVGVNHVVEIFIVFLYFIPGPVGVVAGLITIWFQGMLIASGNFSWLNVITLVLCIPVLNDDFFAWIGMSRLPDPGAMPLSWYLVSSVAFLYLCYRSYQPLLNLFAKQQAMNRSFDPFHIVNTYGAFGSITRDRPEIIFQGTQDALVSKETVWEEYHFKGKPGDVKRCPPQVTPYHYKLDWQLWFAAMSDYRYNPWTLNLVAKFLRADKGTMGLLRRDPFNGKRPRFVKAEVYLYKFTNMGEEGYWKRVWMHSYLPPLSLNDESFREYLKDEEWE